MQFAERWIGLGSLVVAFAATGFVARPSSVSNPDRLDHARVDLRRTHCSGAALGAAPGAASGAAASGARPESIDRMLLEGREPDPYTPVFARAALAHCFGDQTRVEMLVEIAADGHVSEVTHRPDRPTRASRCIAHAVRHLQFPAGNSAVAIRYVFTK
ncbi:MAG: hypothetical protein ABI467_10500 [Kofleriaceae bacterium]